MKKTSFVIAILASALLAGACGKKKEPAAPAAPMEQGSAAPDEGSAAPAEGAPAEGAPAEGEGSGSAM